MKRFWFEFGVDTNQKIPFGILIGCGVTAFDYEDALEIIRKKVFEGNRLPHITREVENIDVSTLDQRHVVPNMSSPHTRGIWFPLGYD